MAEEKRCCGNCGAHCEGGGLLSCRRHQPPWPNVASDWWCFEWVPETQQGEGIVVTEADIAGVGELTPERIAAAIIAVERRLDRGGL